MLREPAGMWQLYKHGYKNQKCIQKPVHTKRWLDAIHRGLMESQ